MSANRTEIQLGKFIKKENWEFRYALSIDPTDKWIVCFRDICVEMDLDADIRAHSFIVEPNRNYAVISGGINSSESEIRLQLEKAICKTNEKNSDRELILK